MPTAREKHMARGFPRPDRVARVDLFTDIELNQASPHLCAICEFEGELVICDGHCHRQFHRVASVGDHVGDCPGVVIPEDQMDRSWLCPDCAKGEAMCFKCHTVGTYGTLVRKCPLTYCVRMYCLSCLPNDVTACRLHQCDTCKQEHESDQLIGVVQCLRCPTSWCRDCLRFIQKKGYAPGRETYSHSAHGTTRWVFYCQEHDIVPPRETPVTNHIAWIAQ